MSIVSVDPDSPTAPFEQVRLGVIENVRNGALVAGTKIPTVRQLAAELGLAPNTVARAYRELEQDGVIETRGRSGSFIKSSGDGTRDRAGRAASEYVAAVRHLGLADEDALAYVRAALRGSG